MQKHFIYSDKWLDLLFENKNKKYGAYLLRKREADRTLIALFAALGIYGLVAASVYFGDKIYHALHPAAPPTEIPKIEAYKILEVILPPIAHPPIHVETITPPAATKSQDYKVVDEKLKTNPTDIIKPIENPVLTPTGPTGPATDLTLKPTTAIASFAEPTKPIFVADVNPEFPGGMDGLQRYLEKNIHYPSIYIDSRKGGLVYLQFVVNENGNVTQVEVKKGIKDAIEFEQEAMRVVNAMPRWKPGIYAGKNAAVYFTLPVNFQVR